MTSDEFWEMKHGLKVRGLILALVIGLSGSIK
jgi:hypothetical protein